MLPHSCQFIQISLPAHLASEACLWWPVGPISSLFSLFSPQTLHYLSVVRSHWAMSTCPGCPNWPPEARRSQPGGSSQSEQRKLPATSPHPGPRVWRVINKNNHKIIWKLNIIALLLTIPLLIFMGREKTMHVRYFQNHFILIQNQESVFLVVLVAAQSINPSHSGGTACLRLAWCNATEVYSNHQWPCSAGVHSYSPAPAPYH